MYVRHRATRAVAAFCCAVSLGVYQRAAAQNVSVSDYDVPVSSADRLIIDFAGTHATSGSDTTASNAKVGGIYKRFYDSLPFGYSIDVVGSGDAVKNLVADEYDTNYALNGSGTVRKYLSGDEDSFLMNAFAGLRVNADVLKDYDNPATSAVVSVGYGRFIGATALAKAVRMEQFLIDEGEISDHLPKAAILELSQIISRRSEFEDIHGDTYQRDWFAAMESTIRDSGLLVGDSIGAIGILRMKEVLDFERIADRFYGWDVSAGTKVDLTLPFEGQDRPPLGLDVAANYARPISWKTQWNERLQLNSPVDDLGKAYTLTLASDVTYELSNRVDVRVQHVLNSTKIADVDAQVSQSLGASIIYYLANQLNLVGSALLQKQPGEDATTNTTVTLDYRIF